MDKYKKIIPDDGNRLKVSIDTTPKLDFKYPVFCLKYLHKNHSLSQCTQTEKIALITRLERLSKMSWLEIQLADKHGFGSEKISQSSIKPSIPAHLTKDVDFLALRFDGKKPMVGYKTDFIFHIVYLDRDFTVNSHGGK